ncbi:restriction endonuclease subunit S [Klebsiella aerogenes]
MNVDNKVPEIRFQGFSEEWKKRKMSDCSSKIGDGLHGTPKYTDNTGIYFINGNNLVSGSILITDETKQVSIDEQSKDDNSLDLNTLLLSINGTIGNLAWYQGQRIMLGKSVAFIKLENCDNSYMYAYMQTKRIKNYFLNSLTGSTIKNLGLKTIRESTVVIPNERKEQIAIGNYFQKFDSLINQHQQKYDKLRNIKKAMLEKMFPKQGGTIPEIRFKGFSGEWENIPFGACFVNVPNNTLSRADLNYEDGMAKNIHYGDVLIKFGEVLDATNELLPFITNNDVANKLKHATLRDGDIIIADAAEDSMVGKCTELFNVDEQLVLSGLHTIAVRPTFPFASKYLGYYLNSSSYHDQLFSLMQGTKVLSISKTAIQNTNVRFPKRVEEQAAIGNYFQKLDNLINQHQQQITKLNDIKQACLNKMFV